MWEAAPPGQRTAARFLQSGLFKAPLYPKVCADYRNRNERRPDPTTNPNVISPIVMTPVSAITPQGQSQQFTASAPVTWSAVLRLDHFEWSLHSQCSGRKVLYRRRNRNHQPEVHRVRIRLDQFSRSTPIPCHYSTNCQPARPQHAGIHGESTRHLVHHLRFGFIRRPVYRARFRRDLHADCQRV